jgi:hypothetical protein
MDIAAALSLAGQFGPMGLLVGYLIWRDKCDDKRRSDETAEHNKLLAADTLAREKLAQSLGALGTIIQGRPHV